MAGCPSRLQPCILFLITLYTLVVYPTGFVCRMTKTIFKNGLPEENDDDKDTDIGDMDDNADQELADDFEISDNALQPSHAVDDASCASAAETSAAEYDSSGMGVDECAASESSDRHEPVPETVAAANTVSTVTPPSAEVQRPKPKSLNEMFLCSVESSLNMLSTEKQSLARIRIAAVLHEIKFS